jgi:hypothetical protein
MAVTAVEDHPTKAPRRGGVGEAVAARNVVTNMMAAMLVYFKVLRIDGTPHRRDILRNFLSRLY